MGEGGRVGDLGKKRATVPAQVNPQLAVKISRHTVRQQNHIVPTADRVKAQHNQPRRNIAIWPHLGNLFVAGPAEHQLGLCGDRQAQGCGGGKPSWLRYAPATLLP